MQYTIPKDRGLTSQQLWITGRFSPRAVEELETRKWEIHQQAFFACLRRAVAQILKQFGTEYRIDFQTV